MSRQEPPVSPPHSRWCSLCEVEITDESDGYEVRGLDYCNRCGKAQRHG